MITFAVFMATGTFDGLRPFFEIMGNLLTTIIMGFKAKNDAYRCSLAPFRHEKFSGLPPVGPKNLINIDLSARKSPKETLIQTWKICSYWLNSQWHMKHIMEAKNTFLCFEGMPMDFEFNKPISKNATLISKDFEKNSTDFEGFAMDFENAKPFRSSAAPKALPDLKGLPPRPKGQCKRQIYFEIVDLEHFAGKKCYISTMKKKKLGNTGIEIAPLVFGGNVFGWTIDEKKSFELLDAFTGAGFNLVDTADVYSRWKAGNVGGESETVIGNWMKQRGNRAQVMVATKVGSDMGQGKKDLSKKYILKAAEDSLRRLQTDYIDLYQTHFDDLVTPVEETLEAYTQLIKEGKVKHVGASNVSPERLQASFEASRKNGYARYETLQPWYNLYEREVYEKELEAIATEHKLGVISYFSLASGFLSGKYRNENDLNKSVRGQGVKKYLNERGFNILKALDEAAAKYNSTPAAIALAWLIARPGVTAPIASATNLEQLNTLFKSAELELDEHTLQSLNAASAWQSENYHGAR